MGILDWIVLGATLFIIVFYGIWKSRHTKSIETYLLADRQLPWYHVGLSVMATQASAITFLSAPGQAYTDGMRFVQFYFGLPLAMIVLCVSFVPIFHKLNVFTAYEYLEKRFDKRTRLFTALLFLIQRGISTGITIYAPSIVLSTLLGLPILYTTLIMGSLVIFYTVYGGTKAVSYTQLLQMSIIFGGLIIAAILIVRMLPQDVGVVSALKVAGKMGRMNAIDWNFDVNSRYNVWSGLIGGFFLQLSYFGTDQSQVGRYLTGSSIKQSRIGLVMNGLLKIPMQFFILFIGVLVFSFYQFHPSPAFFNQVELSRLEKSIYKDSAQALVKNYEHWDDIKRAEVKKYVAAADELKEGNYAVIQSAQTQMDTSRARIKRLMLQENPMAESDDGNYIFLRFVMDFLPKGMIGLLMAIIFLAAMGSTASGLNSLASTTVVDFLPKKNGQASSLKKSRWVTAIWGLFCMLVALYAGRMGNLIEAVNILGSLFYGTILGIFLVAFFMKQIKGREVFLAAVLTEIVVVIFWYNKWTSFLWLNLLGSLLLMAVAGLLHTLRPTIRMFMKGGASRNES